MFGKPASTLPCAAQIFDAVGQGVKRGVAVIGVGVEGKADIRAEVVQSAGKNFGLCNHAAAGLVGAVVSAFMFACAEADADSLRQSVGQPIEYTAVLPPDRRRHQQIMAEAFGAGEQGIEAVQGAERMAEDGLVLGIDAVFAVEQGGEFVVDKVAEAVGLAVLFAFGFGRVVGQRRCVVEGALA